MFKKFFSVLLVLMLVNVHGCFPAYAEEEEVYTLKRGKVYEFRFRGIAQTKDFYFSDDVLFGQDYVDDYYDLSAYQRYGRGFRCYVGYVDNIFFVYNVADKDVTLILESGILNELIEYDSPFSLVAYDASENYFEITNLTDENLYYTKFHYNEHDESLTYDKYSKKLESGETALYVDKGILLLEKINTGNVQYSVALEGDYEVNNYIRKSFFRIPPWILKTDLAGIIRVLLDQLSTLLPVGLVILSVFLLISLAKYIIRLFL